MSRVALVSHEEIEKLSNGICRMGRDMRPSNGSDDLDELREEEIWGESETSGGRDGSHHYVKEGFHVLQQSVKHREGSSKSMSKSRKSLLTMELQASNRNGYYESTQSGHGNAQGDVWSTGASSKNNDWTRNGRADERGVPQSAPVSVPVWLRRRGGDDDQTLKNDSLCCDGNGHNNEEDEFDDIDHDEKGRRGRRLPPHEIVAREYARSQATTFSVCEGAGRTLKGMDLRRVRNAVWSRTGFVD